MLIDLANTTASIRRTSTVSGKQVYADVSTGVTCRIQPASDHAASLNDIQYGQGFVVFFDTAVDVRANDQLVISGITYSVRGVKDNFGSLSGLSHKEVLAVKQARS